MSVMLEKLSLAPRPFSRPVKTPGGGWVQGDKRTVQPVAFGQERAEAVMAEARTLARCGPVSDQVERLLTDGEAAYVRAVWDCMGGGSCWWSAWCEILNGRV